MLGFVSRRKDDAVCADRERIRGERDQFLEDREAAQSAARTAAELYTDTDSATLAAREERHRVVVGMLRTELQELRDALRTPEGGTTRSQTASRELTRALDHARALDTLVGQLQAANDQLSRELREAREGAVA